MKKGMKRLSALLLVFTVMFAFSGCKKDTTDYAHYRNISWEGKELTISLGENKGTDCNWETHSQDDSVIDYSINRVFHLSDRSLKEGEAFGILDAGFEGKGPGTTQIICTTPCNWDGTGEGYTYIVTVTVAEDGTIVSATAE